MFGVDEVVHVDPFRCALGLVLDAAVVEGADELFLLGVHADHRLAGGHESLRQLVQVAELAVTVGMGRPFFDLGRRLQRVAETLEDPPDGVVGDRKALAHQVLGQVGGGLRRPAQQRHRVAPGLGVHQLVQCLGQAGLGVDQRLGPRSRRPHPIRRLRTADHLLHAGDHGAAAHARRLGHSRLPAPPQHSGRRSHQKTSLTLVQLRCHHLEESREPFRGDLHIVTLLRASNYTGDP